MRKLWALHMQGTDIQDNGQMIECVFESVMLTRQDEEECQKVAGSLQVSRLVLVRPHTQQIILLAQEHCV